MGLQQHWETVADNNDDADAAINLRENQSPSTYNNAVRAAMAAMRKFSKDINGSLVTGGSSTAYTLTTNEGFTALADGMTVSARLNATNGASPTLNVDGLGAVAIQIGIGSAPAAGQLLVNTVQQFTYYAAGPAWLVSGVSGVDAGAVVARPFAAGVVQTFGNNSAPTGWVKDTSFTDAAIRLTDGNVGDGGSMDFDSCFSSGRTITQAMLPSFNLSFSLQLVSGVITNGSSVIVGSMNSTVVSPAGGTAVLRPDGLSTAGISVNNPAVNGTISSGGSGSGMPFNVKYAKMIRATIS